MHDETGPEPINKATPESVTVATDPEIEAAIRNVMDQVPLANRHAVCRAALRVGVRVLVADPVKTIGLLREQTVRVTQGKLAQSPSSKAGGQ